MNSRSGIYEIFNLKSKKRYVGQSIDLNRRRNRHFRKLSTHQHYNQHLQNSYDKYGKNNFEFNVLIYCEPFELTKYEQFFVDKYDKQMLYNVCLECVDSTKGITLSEERKEKISNSMKGKVFSEETKTKISRAKSGKNHHFYGKCLSKEHRNKMSMAHSGKKNHNYGKHPTQETIMKMSGENNHESKLTKKQVFEILSLFYNKNKQQKNISKKYDISNQEVSLICRGKRWKNIYKKFMKNNPDARDFSNGRFYNSKLTQKQVFEILDLFYNKNILKKDIAKKYSVGYQTIYLICNGKTWNHCYKDFMEKGIL